ncbi:MULTISPECIES: hypothetical protein [Micromonospora]|uniref:Lipoprotein n=1 Tax=Micromonospora solifontis TaxID=2487138 RepID=A0ABX9WGQ6_9ACTN|nr:MULTISPECIES: hypothetical protein [Micromonospora]NES14434.1 hypothetical protein [Micromonospora sp. PPF5-17B]NES36777.1 hypothetical protein [Micromonospora solifontis]NES56365.1 hypothetical protein [Micromonospora sp. PPF5-6]RNL99107.1 hypothetical protein EFE23_11505 [Micromonospora solifontis]
MRRQALLRTPVVALAAALAVTGCSSGTSDTEATATTSVTEAPGGATATADAGGVAATPGGAGTTGAGTPRGGTGSSGGGSGGKPTTGAPTGDAPGITYFRVAQQPSCPGGTTANPIAGTPAVVEWKTSDVDSVTLSVDGPGVYADNLPPTGSETLNFPCSGAEGDVQRHTYLLTVRNSAGKRTKTLVVSATVHEIKQV